MITIRLTFAAGRYHATQWGRHVNEGVPEWPPSPYRLLRALYDVWQRKCFDVPSENVRGVFEALANEPPEFILPQATATHTRSYLSANSADPTDKSLVFDAFLAFAEPRICYMSWAHAELDKNQEATLDRLLRQMNYLGRSESWIEAAIAEAPMTGGIRCVAVSAGDESQGELTRVACVVPAREHTGSGTWMDALTYSTSNLLKQRTSSPPLLRHVAYVLPENAIETDPPKKVLFKEPTADAVLIALDATVLPLATTALEIAEQVRVRLMGAHKRIVGEANVSPLFSGKDSDGQKRLDHGHVYIFPLSNKGGRIDRVLIVSPLRPFTRSEVDAVRHVTELWQSDNRGTVQCVMTGQGKTAEFARVAQIVESSTPFVAPRHWRKGRDFAQFLLDEVQRECVNHRVSGTVLKVEQLEKINGLFHQVEYRHNRKGDPVRQAVALRVTFDREIQVPFAIGYGAHFGLGQFLGSDGHRISD